MHALGSPARLTKRVLELFIGFGLVLGDFEKSSQKWGFPLDWMLSGSGSNYMVGIFINLLYREGRPEPGKALKR